MSGTQVRLNDDYDEQLSRARQKLSQELDKQDAELAKFYESNKKTAASKSAASDSTNSSNSSPKKSPADNLPPELRAKFAEMLKREDD